MPRAYLITVCDGSSLDRETNNWSLFNIIEEVHIDKEEMDAAEHKLIAPAEVHVQLAGEAAELERNYEVRVVVKGKRGGAKSNSVPFRMKTRRHRLRLLGLPLPETGELLVGAEIRTVPEGEWEELGLWWPVQVDHAVPGQGT